jgi:hypothetical protein
MSLTIPTAIAALLPLLATILSSWLNDDHFKPGINALIALIAILLTATICEWLAGGFIPGNEAVSFLAILGYVGVLMAGDFSVLYQYLVAKPSPVSRALGMPVAPATQTPTTSVVTKAYIPPAPIVLPPPTSTTPKDTAQ